MSWDRSTEIQRYKAALIICIIIQTHFDSLILTIYIKIIFLIQDLRTSHMMMRLQNPIY